MSKKKRILVLDDDENVFNLLKTFLGEYHELYHARSVKEATDKTPEVLPHLIFLDLNLDGPSGFNYLQWKKKQGYLKDSKVIAISQDAFSKNVKTAIALGASDFIAKPLVNQIVIRKTKKAFLHSFEFSRTILEKHKKATCKLEYKVINQNDISMVIESSLRLAKDVPISINGLNFVRRGGINARGHGLYSSALFQTGDEHGSRDFYSDETIYTIEDRLKEKSPSIFILDDDENFTNLIDQFFSKLNIRLSVFNNKKDFNSLIKKSSPDIILLDLSIQSTNDGFEFIERLKKEKPQTPILVVTASTEEPVLLHTLETGASDYMVKPLKRNHLLQKIAGLIFEDVSRLFANTEGPSHQKGELELNISLLKFNEFHLYLESESYIAKGSMLTIQSDYLNELLNKKEIKVMVTYTEGNTDSLGYILTCEYVDLEREDVNRILSR